MRMTNQEIENLCKKLLAGYINNRAFRVSLEEFQKFYSTFINLTKNVPVVSLINLEDVIVAQFSSLSPQHFDIFQKHMLEEDDFEFIQNKRWYGAKKRSEKFGFFLWKELRQNFVSLILIAAIGFSLLFWVNNNELYNLMVSLFIQSSTVFLSLYIIFTVSQSQKLYQDISLFKTGILHKYFRDDKNVTLLGILTVAFTFLNSILIHLFAKYEATINDPLFGTLARISKATFTTIILVLLFDMFITVANYYLERNRDIIERDIVITLLDKDYTEIGNKRNI
jgi:hypothetical protein